MRLLEPLNGIKMGQGHYIIHLYFFVTMFFIDTSIDIDLSNWLPKDVAKKVEKEHEHHIQEEKDKAEKEKNEHPEEHHMNLMSDDYEAPGYW